MRKCTLITIISILVVIATTSSVRAALVSIDGNGNATGITDVTIGSIGIFDVDFIYGKYSDVFSANEVFADFLYQQAITDALNAVTPTIPDRVADESFSVDTIEFSIPKTAPSGPAISQWGTRSTMEKVISVWKSPKGGFIAFPPSQANMMWAKPTFIQAVPEPSVELLLGISLIGLVGVGAVRKIKQKKAVANT